MAATDETAGLELADEMNAPVFKEYDPDRPWVIVRKDYDEGTRAMWHEYERFATNEEAMRALRQIRGNQYHREDTTGEVSSLSYKVVEEK